MRLEKADLADKGWYLTPANSSLPVSIGYANQGIDEPHLHSHVTEIYLVARGTSDIRVEQETVHLEAGDLLIVEPGEGHTFLSSSPDYFHFVLHIPGLPRDSARQDKVAVSKARLSLGQS